MAAQSLTFSFAMTHSFTIEPPVSQAIPADAPRVGEFLVDYSELSAEELAATDPFIDDLLANSRVVSSKRL